MLQVNDQSVNIADIIESPDFDCNPLHVRSSNHLFRIDTGKVSYILKIYNRKACFEKELDMIYLFMKKKCRVPELVKYSSNASLQWILYLYEPGISLYEARYLMTTKELSDIFRQAGQALKKIHSICLSGKDNEKYRTDYLIWLKNKLINHVSHLAHTDEYLCEAIRYLADFYPNLTNSYYGYALYDFNDKHIIVEKVKHTWQLRSFVDFEEVIWGCIYTDTVGLYLDYFLDNQKYEKCFWEGYGKAMTDYPEHRKYAAFFLLQYGVEMCALYNQKNKTLFDDGISIIKKTLTKLV